MTHNGTTRRDPYTVAAEDKAAQVCMRVSGRRDRLPDVLVAEFEELYRASGAQVRLADDSPFCWPDVSWPQAWRDEGEPTGAFGAVLVTWIGVLSFVAGALWQWLRT